MDTTTTVNESNTENEDVLLVQLSINGPRYAQVLDWLKLPPAVRLQQKAVAFPRSNLWLATLDFGTFVPFA